MDEFKFNGTPVPKPRMTVADKWKKRPVIQNYWAFKDTIVKEALRQKFVLGEAFEIEFGLPLTTKSKKVLGTPHRQRPDVDNLLKAVMDCLLPEDSSVHTVYVSKRWSEKGFIKIKNISVANMEIF